MSNSFVPRGKLVAMGFLAYSDYLRSPHWTNLRKRFFASKLVRRSIDGRALCTACGNQIGPLSLHHKSYKRFGAEWLMDLVLLCQPCHELAHAAHRENKRDGLWRVTKRVIKTGQRATP